EPQEPAQSQGTRGLGLRRRNVVRPAYLHHHRRGCTALPPRVARQARPRMADRGRRRVLRRHPGVDHQLLRCHRADSPRGHHRHHFDRGHCPGHQPRPRLQHFRVLALSVDEHEGLELYIARYLPRATLARNPEQAYTSGDTATTWGMTFTSTLDNEAGYSERYFFGGPGWRALLGEMGFASLPEGDGEGN